MTTDAQVREFLRRLRAPAPEIMRAVFTRGGCYALHEILAGVFPKAEPWGSFYNGRFDGEHVVTRIDGRFYDIIGQRHLKPSRDGMTARGLTSILKYRMTWRRMTARDCAKARKWSPVVWDQVVKR